MCGGGWGEVGLEAKASCFSLFPCFPHSFFNLSLERLKRISANQRITLATLKKITAKKTKTENSVPYLQPSSFLLVSVICSLACRYSLINSFIKNSLQSRSSRLCWSVGASKVHFSSAGLNTLGKSTISHKYDDNINLL